ncbi:MAG: (2Fe-2S)-binding protein [Deltaproteobacteria bacterium]|nr:(2Fe-2S)-binding protein [Deltaproteobacteria bacterium]
MNKQECSDTEKSVIRLLVNGRTYDLPTGEGHGAVVPTDTLAHTLRETLGLTGTKIGCDQGSCGSCTVLMNGKPILSCMTLTVECEGAVITTIEGLEDRETGRLHPLQQAFINHTAFQCGFCTPGILLSAKALLDREPDPGEADVKQALTGHYCRCISHYEVVEAVLDAAKRVKHE